MLLLLVTSATRAPTLALLSPSLAHLLLLLYISAALALCNSTMYCVLIPCSSALPAAGASAALPRQTSALLPPPCFTPRRRAGSHRPGAAGTPQQGIMVCLMLSIITQHLRGLVNSCQGHRAAVESMRGHGGAPGSA